MLTKFTIVPDLVTARWPEIQTLCHGIETSRFHLSDREIVVWNESDASRISERLREAGYKATIWFVTTYDEIDLSSAEVLRLEIGSDEKGASAQIRCLGHGESFSSSAEHWRGGPPSADKRLVVEIYHTKLQPLLVAYPSHALVISRTLKEHLVDQSISGLTFSALWSYDENTNQLLGDESYFLATIDSLMPPIDPRVLVRPWKVPDGQSGSGWNYPIVSEFIYSYSTLATIKDINRLNVQELGARVPTALVVTPKLRSCLAGCELSNMQYQPVRVAEKVSGDSIVELSWSHQIGSPRDEAISLAEARRRHGPSSSSMPQR